MAKKPTKLDALIDRYYARLTEFRQQYALHEGAVSEAFQTLLADAGRPHHWTLIPQLTDKQAGRHIRPDGTFKDIFLQVRGHWEAKDTKDDLAAEVSKKTLKGYPLTNIIFEDTREAVLIQNKTQVMKVELTDRRQLTDLLNAFFAYIEPQIEGFEKAVTEFKERVPDIAKGLKELIEYAHRGNGKTGPDRITPNQKFIAAYATFMDVCRNALNPNITESAVDDMLVQHLLTERLIREIFDNPEFTRRNVIAAEIEKVIEALTSKAFNRDVFLKSLDRFYLAIESSARTMPEWSDKQGFLNTVYERFFQGYSVKLADTMGIVYTPQPIVDFMCASVVEVLEKEFGRTLGDPGVNILDPCTGTGNFIVNLLRRVPKKDLPRVYKEQLFANEIMLLPYYIAALNIEHAYYEQTGEYEAFEGLCFVDTLDLAESHQAEMSFMTAKNTERVERQKRTPITVIIGNPPYNANQTNEDDNNKNRGYPVIDGRVKQTYVSDGTAKLKNKLYDPYIRFFRWASDRLGNNDGIICFVSNNSFLEGKPFDGMRRHLNKDFQHVFVMDLKGDIRRDSMRDGIPLGEKHTVFGLAAMVGIAITILVRKREAAQHQVSIGEVNFRATRDEKFSTLLAAKNIYGSIGQSITPRSDQTWLQRSGDEEFGDFSALGEKHGKSLFKRFSTGAKSNRDDVVYDTDRVRLASRVENFIEAYNAQIDKWKRKKGDQSVDDFVDATTVKWSSTLKSALMRGKYTEFEANKIRLCAYRPFTNLWLYYDEVLNDRPGLFRNVFPSSKDEAVNRVLCITGHSQLPFLVQMVSRIANEAVGGRAGVCFPFYVYDEDGSNRRENITDWSLDQFRTQYQDKAITKWDIFHYVYGLLHHPGYRTKFADNLKRELPRIPFAPDFRAFAVAGKHLAALHLDYETLEPWPLTWVETPGVPLSYGVEKMKLSRDKATLTVNPSLTLGGIPPAVGQYRLGNRSALEWVVDQYQTSTDKRSGIVSDPNRDDDPQYIVRLVGQVVRVSVETVKIVDGLPGEFAAVPGGDAAGASAAAMAAD